MTDTSGFFYLGRVIKTHGIHGEMSGLIEADDPLVYSTLHSAFVKTKQGLIPFPFEEISIDPKGFFTLRIRDVDSAEKAKRFIRKELYLPLDFLPELSGNNFYFHEILNFRVTDIKLGHIGTIAGVIEHSSQPLFQIMNNGKEILVPIHDDFIIEVNRKEKTILLKTPEGLISVYLEE